MSERFLTGACYSERADSFELSPTKLEGLSALVPTSLRQLEGTKKDVKLSDPAAKCREIAHVLGVVRLRSQLYVLVGKHRDGLRADDPVVRCNAFLAFVGSAMQGIDEAVTDDAERRRAVDDLRTFLDWHFGMYWAEASDGRRKLFCRRQGQVVRFVASAHDPWMVKEDSVKVSDFAEEQRRVVLAEESSKAPPRFPPSDGGGFPPMLPR